LRFGCAPLIQCPGPPKIPLSWLFHPRDGTPTAVEAEVLAGIGPTRETSHLADILATAQKLEGTLSAPPGSLVGLWVQDDWTFVIKSHALLEAAVSQMLANALDRRLDDVFGRLELGRTDVGKLAFAHALELLSSEERGFIRTLSDVRNLLAHDLRHLDFDLSAHVNALDKQQRERFFKHFDFGIAKEDRVEWLEFCRVHVKIGIAAGVVRLVSSATLAGKFAQYSREEGEIALRDFMRGYLRPPEYGGRERPAADDLDERVVFGVSIRQGVFG
jgi:hypothetical protein